ncbi:Ig-like domain-containing protein [Robertmurraya kyonggiensis]|uniref:Fibronectin type III domain-containing protein n=1 Tax=Robertmurraya kyonggiensis TaxID=1037680 RepID=A0A4U1D3K6_9BACI|nr:Ig-like domain-containing protein [Robertmurraya kyonggiensis]TKC16975.1 fibronectin type III domain-containing protein [Robertmurraya kyonggiensis]
MKSKWISIVLLFVLLIASIPYVPHIDAAERIIEVTNYRTENTRTFRNSNLTETIDVFPFPIFTKNELGKYQPTDVGSEVKNIGYVSQSEGDSNFISDNQVLIGTDEQGEYRTYINFGQELPNLEGKLLVDATLKLYSLDGIALSNGSFSLHKVLNEWKATELTWNNQPEFSPLPTETNVSAGSTQSWSITELVKEWYEEPTGNHGVVLKSSEPSILSSINSFYKTNSNLNLIPVLQITYEYPPTVQVSSYGLGLNSGKGVIELSWFPVQGAKGYKVLMFNGKDYEEIDVGDSRSWSSRNKNVWPTTEQIKSGVYQLRLDGSGEDLDDQAVKVYENADGNSMNRKSYYYKILAHNDYDEVVTEEIAVSIPDQTAPSMPANLRMLDEDIESFTIAWDESIDLGSGVKGYNVTLTTSNGQYYPMFTNTNSIKIPKDLLSLYTPYTITVRATDNYYSQDGNYSAASVIKTQARLKRDSRILNYSSPSGQLNYDSTTFLRFTFRNEGAEEWSNENGYELRAEGIDFVEPFKIGEVIKSGEEKAFEFYLPGGWPVGDKEVKWQIYQRDVGPIGDYVERTLRFVDMTEPEVMLTSPISYDSVSGNVPITGTIKDYSLDSYNVFYGEGNSPTSWTKIATGTSQQDILGVWNTKGLPSGLYTIRLEALDTSGNRTTIDRKVYVNIPPSAPNVYEVADHSTVKGMAKAGSTVIVKKNGALIGSGISDKNGYFTVSIPKQVAGTLLTVTAKDAFENTSLPTSVVVYDRTAPTIPVVNTVANTSTVVTGTGEAGSKISVYKGSSLLGTATIPSNGKFSVKIPKQTEGTVLVSKVTDKAGNISSARNTTVIDKLAPATPKVIDIANNTKTIIGTAEKYATIRVKRGTTVIGSATVKVDGKFSLNIPLQKDGTILYVTATDKAGNVSAAVKKTVLDKIAPAIPSVNTIRNYHTKVTGKAEPYSIVTVKRGSVTLGTAKTNSKGSYSVSIKKQKRKSLLTITAKDSKGNASKGRQFYVK